MVFSSVLFLFLFLPAVVATILTTPRRAHNYVLLLFSLLFYAWGEGARVAILLGSIAVTYVAGVALDRIRRDRARAWTLAAGVAANLMVLGTYKYANFVVDSLNAWLPLIHLSPVRMDRVHLPIGISFFTFQAVSYLVDVYRRDCRAQTNPFNTALYIALFPQLVAGPIVRYSDLSEQINRRAMTLAGFAQGSRRFIMGLAKKVLIANVLSVPADAAFSTDPSHLSTAMAWLGVAAYSLQIYFDFSGYSDMAIGMGRMFGFQFRENFEYPYVSQSIREFWRRWHISLSTWFRDYLYIPLGGSRRSSLRTYANLLVVFFLCGLWHGASWTFVVWGLFHGTFLVLERLGLGRLLSRAPRLIAHGYTLVVVSTAWVFFRADTLGHALAYMRAQLSLSSGAPSGLPASYYLSVFGATTLLFACVLSAPLYPWFRAKIRSSLRSTQTWTTVAAATVSYGWTMLLLLASAMSLASGTHNPFIYYRF